MSGIILTGQDVFGCPLAEWSRSLTKRTHSERLGLPIHPLGRVATVQACRARVDAGKWIVDCPECGCAEMVWPDAPVMWCSNCGNGGVAGEWRPVDVPDAATMGDVESVLAAVPMHHRFWRPEAETIDGLRARIDRLLAYERGASEQGEGT